MNIKIQLLVARQLISFNEEISLFKYSNGKIQSDGALTALDALKESVASGLNIMLLLDEDEIQPNTSTNINTYYYGYENKITFIEKMMLNNDTNKEIINFLYESLTEEHLKLAHPKFFTNIYNTLLSNNISMRKLFELGFDFEQGNFNEENKAVDCDIDFFECCLLYKKDFDFNFKYEDYTLKEHIKEQKEDFLNNRKDIKKYEVLENFIDKAILKQFYDNKDQSEREANYKLKI